MSYGLLHKIKPGTNFPSLQLVTGCKIMNNTIEFGGRKYSVHVSESGSISIKRFNEKYGMWVTIHFAEQPTNGEAENFIINMLSKQFIEDKIMGRE